MRYLNVPLEIKEVNEDGTFSGYAAIFGNVDLDGEVIERGAFKEIIKNDDGKVVVLWQHKQQEPIGVADVREDGKGLAFEGSLVLEDATARKARAHMISKSVRGMSIGFDVLKDEIRDGIRYLKELKLWEISLVTFGANPVAGVDAVKSIPEFKTIREVEEWLRDELNLTHGVAKELVVKVKKALGGTRDELPRDEAIREGVKELLNTIGASA